MRGSIWRGELIFKRYLCHLVNKPRKKNELTCFLFSPMSLSFIPIEKRKSTLTSRLMIIYHNNIFHFIPFSRQRV